MSWDQFFLGKEQDQLTGGGSDPATRYGLAYCPPELLCPLQGLSPTFASQSKCPGP